MTEVIAWLKRLESRIDKLAAQVVRNDNFYLFTVTAPLIAPLPGDTYANNGVTYTVISQVGTVFFAHGNGTPQASGNLVRVTGAGSTPIAFSGWVN